MPDWIFSVGHFLRLFQTFFEKPAAIFGSFQILFVEGLWKGKSPVFAATKGGDTMNEPTRTQWKIRCAFNGFCKQALKNEAINAHKRTKWQQLREVTFSYLTPQEENQLYTYDSYFADDEAEQSFTVAGKKIRRSCLPKPCTACRRTNATPFYCTTSLKWATRKSHSYTQPRAARYSTDGQALLSFYSNFQ